MQRGEAAFRASFVMQAAALAVLLAPPLFGAFFATSLDVTGGRVALFPGEVGGLWLVSCSLALLAAAVVRLRERVPQAPLLVLFGALLLVWPELGARAWMNIRYDPGQGSNPLAEVVYSTYPRESGFLPNPLLQYVRPDRFWPTDPGSREPPRWAWQKPPGEVRVLLLGGSTADSFLPVELEEELNEGEGPTYRVLQLATAGYSSAQSLAAFLFIGLDVEADYVVLHHGWNDAMAWGQGEAFRGDYSHALRPFAFPDIPDRHLVRGSVLYRWIRYGTETPPVWALLSGWRVEAMEADHSRPPTEHELGTFRRNVELVADTALARGIRPVLATMPRSLDPRHEGSVGPRSIPICNEVLREVAAARGQRVLLVDLDETMTGSAEERFTDLAHVDREGDRMKGRQIAAAILAASSAPPARVPR